MGILAEDLDSAPWPAGSEATSRFLSALARDGTSAYVSNIAARPAACIVDGAVLPVSVCESGYGNALTASPYAGWLRLPLEQACKRKRWATAAAIAGASAGLAPLLQMIGLNRVAAINDWFGLVRTFPRVDPKRIPEIVREIRTRLPDRPIVFRALLPDSNPSADALARAGARVVPRRLVYLADGADPNVRRRRNIARDMTLLERTDIEAIRDEEFRSADLERCPALFAQVYIHKYSVLAPRYTERWFRLCHETRLLDFRGLRLGGRLVGMIGLMDESGALRLSVIGYDTRLPRELGIYRRLFAIAFREAIERKLPIHLGSGADEFKLSRGARPALEHAAILFDHLDPLRRRAWLQSIRLIRPQLPENVPVLRGASRRLGDVVDAPPIED